MGEIVAGIGMSHAPGLTGWPDAPPEDVQEHIRTSLAAIREYLLIAQPDVIVSFLDDHFDNISRRLCPPIALAVADRHWGPAEYYLKELKIDERVAVPSSADFSSALLHHLLESEFDIARLGEVEYCQNLMVPQHRVWPENQFAVVPLFFNVFTPPLTPPRRAHDVGRAVRRFAEHRPERIAFLATGGLSHWPPFWNESSPDDDPLLQRMRRFQTEGRQVLQDDPHLMTDFGVYETEMAAKSEKLLVNEDWDRRFLEAFAAGDAEYMRSLEWEEIAVEAGPGGNEVLNWIALMGAMGDAPAKVLSYDVSPEWITGVAFTVYE